MGQGLLSLLLKNPQQPALVPQPTPLFLVVLEVIPGHIGITGSQELQLLAELGDTGLVLGQIQAGQVAAKAALHQLPGLRQVVALQQIQHHAVAGSELAHQRIGGTGGQGAGLPHPFKAALHRHHIALGVEATSAGPAGHLQEFAAHQRPMAPLGALGKGRDHRGTCGHVDAGRQGFGGEHHLDQALLE